MANENKCSPETYCEYPAVEGCNRGESDRTKCRYWQAANPPSLTQAEITESKKRLLDYDEHMAYDPNRDEWFKMSDDVRVVLAALATITQAVREIAELANAAAIYVTPLDAVAVARIANAALPSPVVAFPTASAPAPAGELPEGWAWRKPESGGDYIECWELRDKTGFVRATCHSGVTKWKWRISPVTWGLRTELCDAKRAALEHVRALDAAQGGEKHG